MNNKLRVFFEFRLPLISYSFIFVSILLLFIFNFRIQPLTSHISQVGILLLFFGFGIRIIATSTVKYLGKIKITGIYAICRHPMLLGQFISFVGLNLMICNIFFTIFSIILFFANDYMSSKKYEKLLSHHYRDIWKIYSRNTNFVIPWIWRIKDAFIPSLSENEVDNGYNFSIFLVIYSIMVEIATLSNM